MRAMLLKELHTANIFLETDVPMYMVTSRPTGLNSVSLTVEEE